MSLDPARWSERAQDAAAWLVIALWLASVVANLIGFGGVPLVRVWGVIAFGIFGALHWRTLLLPWTDIASWTIPLTIWMAAGAIAAPVPIAVALLASFVAGGWLVLFVVPTPFVRWWYRWALHKPCPFVFPPEGPGDGTHHL